MPDYDISNLRDQGKWSVCVSIGNMMLFIMYLKVYL